jgi:hypothetical protein
MMLEGRTAVILLIGQGLLLAAVSALAARLWRRGRKQAEAPPAPPGEPLAGPVVSLRPDARSWPSGPLKIDPKARPVGEADGAVEAKRPAVLISVPRLGAGGDAERAWAALEERHGAIWAMADTGRSAAEIAGETGRSAAEVDLILALRRRARAGRAGGAA